jgi:hypothetical protein
MRPVLVVGLGLFITDVLVLLFWFFSGIYISVYDSQRAIGAPGYLTTHVIAALHFPTTVSIALALEAFKALRNLQRGRVGGADFTGAGYTLSWIVTWFASLGTDLYGMIGLLLATEWTSPAFVIEFTIAVCSTAITSFAMLWGVWLYVRARELKIIITKKYGK